MEQIGVVKNIKGNTAIVEINRISGCGGACKTCSGCDTPSFTINLENIVDAKIGDKVKVKADTKNMLKYTAIAYLIPLIMFVVSTVIANKIFHARDIFYSDFYSFLVGLVFIGISYLIIRKIDKNITARGESSVEIIEIL